MNRVELVRKVASVLRENNVRKPVSVKKHVFHISDDNGNTSNFVVKKSDKDVIYTNDDVTAIVDTCIEVIKDAIKHGEPISIRGFGTLALQYRKQRRTRHPDTGEFVDIPGHYIPKFTFGRDLRMCAKLFEVGLEEAADSPEAAFINDYEIDEEDDDGGDS